MWDANQSLSEFGMQNAQLLAVVERLTSRKTNPAEEKAIADLAAADKDEVAKQSGLDKAQEKLREAQAKLRITEAGRLSTSSPAKSLDWYAETTQGEIKKREDPCRVRQATFFQQQAAYHDRRSNLERRRSESDAKLPQQIAQNARELAEVTELEAKLQPFIDAQAGQRLSPSEADILKKVQAIQASLIVRQKPLENERDRLATQQKYLDSLKQEIDQLDKEFYYEQRLFHEWLEYYQTEIYAAFGGPTGIQRAFKMTISPGDAGMTKTIELLPRQTAMNVNQTNLTQNTRSLSFAFKLLFGLGGKVDYRTHARTL